MKRTALQGERTRLPQLGDRAFPRLMIAPTLLVMLVLTSYPLLYTLIYSFTDYQYLKGTDAAQFIWLKNYIDLFRNTYFRQAVLNTIKFTLLAVTFEMVLGLLLAVFINSLHRGQKVMRTLVLLPYLLPAVTVALGWRMMLSSNYGILNQMLEGLGLPVFNWFMDTKTAFGTVLLIDVWQNVPFVFLLLYASLQSVPETQYEAARIDGAGVIVQFFRITLPNIKNGLALCALLRTIDTFRLFEKVNILTGGGPAGTTSTITQFLYNNGIKSLKFGFGSAGAIVMTLLVLILSSFYIKRAMK
ncbi:MAG: sugar ABC transporter permease [Eubacteriales bacterium]|nr:sugar ABC transporter permease [Eubacteriales bacterium]